MAEVDVQTEPAPTTPSTYGWLTSNPLSVKCGSTLSYLYEGSKNYNRVTKFTIGTVESAVSYAAGSAKPLVGKVVEKLDRPINAVDGMLAGQLVKLEDRYPVIKKQPEEILDDGKLVLYQTLESGHNTLSNTRAASWLGYGVDCTLSATEHLVDRFMPPEEDNEEDVDEEEEEEVKEDENTKPVKKSRSKWRIRVRLGRKKKQPKENDDLSVSSETSLEGNDEGERGDKVALPSRSARAKRISYIVYHRTLRRLQAAQQQCKRSLEQLRASLDLLKYAQVVSGGVDKKYQAAREALKEADSKLRQFLSGKGKDNEECSNWITTEDENEDDDWITANNNKKHLYQHALDFARSISERIYQTMLSVSKVTGYIYLPPRLREGAETTLQQAKSVYSTLKMNNVPSEIPSFVLSQITEVVDTQIGYCHQLGGYINTALKNRLMRSPVEDTADSQGEAEEEEEEELSGSED